MVRRISKNLARMIKLADEVFGMRKDPSQISVDNAVRTRLQRIHPQSLSEKRTKDGPIAWILIFPTTQELMEQFIGKKITERELLKKTPLRVHYDAVYLCSALVLPEYRRKGIARRLMCRAVKAIQKQHSIKFLFFWQFSNEGKKLAQAVAKELSLPLYKKIGEHIPQKKKNV